MSDKELGGSPFYSVVVICALLHARLQRLPHETMKIVVAVMRAWSHHWSPDAMERLVIELRITVVRSSYYILLFILFRVEVASKGDD